MMPSWADQLLPQLLMEQFDTLPIQFRHSEHMDEGVWFQKNFFDKMTAIKTKFFPILVLKNRTFRCEYFCVFDLNKCSRLQD